MIGDNRGRSGGAPALRARIASLETTIRLHRSESLRLAAALPERVQSRVTSSGALILAASFGFCLEQTSRDHSRSLLYLLNAATDASLLLRALR